MEIENLADNENPYEELKKEIKNYDAGGLKAYEISLLSNHHMLTFLDGLGSDVDLRTEIKNMLASLEIQTGILGDEMRTRENTVSRVYPDGGGDWI